jgi:hypothetical protein
MTSSTSLHTSESGQCLIRVRAADTADHGLVIVRSLGAGPPPGCGAPVPRGSGGSLASDIPAGGYSGARWRGGRFRGRSRYYAWYRPARSPPGEWPASVERQPIARRQLTRAWRCSHPESRKRGRWVERKDRSRFDLAALAQLDHYRKWCKLDSRVSILSLKFLISHKITKACCSRRGPSPGRSRDRRSGSRRPGCGRCAAWSSSRPSSTVQHQRYETEEAGCGKEGLSCWSGGDWVPRTSISQDGVEDCDQLTGYSNESEELRLPSSNEVVAEAFELRIVACGDRVVSRSGRSDLRSDKPSTAETLAAARARSAAPPPRPAAAADPNPGNPQGSVICNWQSGDILIGRLQSCRRKIEMTPGAQS